MTNTTPTLEEAAQRALDVLVAMIRDGATVANFDPLQKNDVCRELSAALAAEGERREAVEDLLTAAGGVLMLFDAFGEQPFTASQSTRESLRSTIAGCRELGL